MTRCLRILALVGVAAGLVAAPRPALAQTASLQGDFLKDWTRLKDTMMKIADAMPADKYTFKATPAERDYGAQVLHIAEVNVMLIKTLGGKMPAPTINTKAMSKEDTMKAMAESFDYGIDVLKEQTDQSMAATVQGPPWMGPSTRARLIEFLVGHTQDIYGQMVVYLRLNGITPPASRGR